MAAPESSRVALFATSAGRPLLEGVCACLGIAPARQEERAFEDGEHKWRPLESVRGRDVYVVESLHAAESLSINDRLARVLFFIAAAKDAGAGRVTMVAPYLCYSRKDRRTKSRDPVTTRYVAMLFEAVGTDRILTLDVHNRAAYDNAFRIPAEHLSAASTFVEVFAPMVGQRQVVVVSPDAGGVKRAERFRAALERRLGRPVSLAFIEKFRSEGQVRGGALVGAVDRAVAIIVDDLISTGTTLAMAARACRDAGAAAVHAAATHGMFTGPAPRVLGESALERVITLDTIAHASPVAEPLASRLIVRPCAPLLAAAIERLHVDGSLVELDPA